MSRRSEKRTCIYLSALAAWHTLVTGQQDHEAALRAASSVWLNELCGFTQKSSWGSESVVSQVGDKSINGQRQLHWAFQFDYSN